MALYLVKKMRQWHLWVPWLVALVQLCELPFLPVFPSWYLCIITVWLACSLFFLTATCAYTLLQAVPIALLVLITLPVRIYFLITGSAQSAPFGMIIVYVILGLTALIMFAIDTVLEKKRAFVQVDSLEKEKEFFKTTMETFPECFMIAKLCASAS